MVPSVHTQLLVLGSVLQSIVVVITVVLIFGFGGLGGQLFFVLFCFSLRCPFFLELPG